MTERASFVDAHVGRRIRLLRGLRKYSQEKLAKALGITFQQVQKYERGANRVGAGRLYELAQILEVPVGFFFDELEGFGSPDFRMGRLCEEQAPFQKTKSNEKKESGAADKKDGGIELLMLPETLELARAYYSISDEKIRQQLMNFIRDVAERSS
ncbi:helix-turn-helix transcriptional regulator [Acetobacteraceae bacterium B3987]|nr:helix-turn-helix transcriptional regulator [Acetobacteraceae bacterium B3987]